MTEEVSAEDRACDIGDVKVLSEETVSKVKCDRPLAPRAYGGTVGRDERLGIVTRFAVMEGGRENRDVGSCIH